MPDDKVSIKPFEKVSLTKYDYVEKKDFTLYRDI